MAPFVPAPTTVLGDFTLTAVPSTYVNVRAQPDATGTDLGDLHVGDICKLYTPDSNGWVYLAKGTLKGWVSRQNGAVVFTPRAPVAKIIDASQHQGPVDWTKVKAAGVKTAILRATIGISGTDTAFTANAQGTARVSMQTGFYHIFRPEHNGAAQAQFFYNAIKPYLWWLAPAVDVELDGSDVGQAQTPAQIANGLLSFVQRFEALAGQKPMIYTGNWFWQPHVATTHDDVLGKCLLWIAHYDVPAPAIPHGWCAYTLWQYSASGAVDGITRPVDFNRLP